MFVDQGAVVLRVSNAINGVNWYSVNNVVVSNNARSLARGIVMWAKDNVINSLNDQSQ